MEIYGFTLTESQLGLASIALALLGFLVKQFFDVHNNRRNALRDAVHSYKSAFAGCLSDLGDDAISLDTFENEFDKHKAAVDVVRPLLPKRHRRKLQKAWDEYRGKGTDLGLNDRSFVQANSALVYLSHDATNRQLRENFKKRFWALHDCLNDLL